MSKKIVRNIPKLRFPEFVNESEWQKVKLNKLGKLVSGLTYSPDDIREDGLLVLRSSNVQNGEIKLEDNVYVRTDIKGANLSELNDILICVRNGSKALIGKNALIPDNMPLCTHGAFMTIFRAELPKFVFQLFQTKDYERQVNADLGATINSINGNKFIKYEFYIPVIEQEQKKIADCLSSIDSIISTQSQRIELLKEHKKGLLQNLFPKDGENIPKFRFPEFINNEVWEDKFLKEVLIKNSLKNKDGKYLLVQSVSNKHGFINQDEYFENRRVASKDTSNYYVIKKGFFAYNPSRIDVGSLAYKFDDEPSIISPLYVSFRANKEKIVDIFLLNWFFSENFTSQMIFEGGVRNTLNYENLIQIKIKLPKNIEEQQKIADCLTSIDEGINLQSQRLDALKEHKKALLQQLFLSSEANI